MCDWDFRISDLWYLTPVVNFGEVRRASYPNPLSSPPRRSPWDLFRSFKVCWDAKERVGAVSNGKLPHLSIHSKTAAWVPEFAVEDLPLSRTAVLVPEFAVKDLTLDRILWWCSSYCFNVVDGIISNQLDSNTKFLIFAVYIFDRALIFIHTHTHKHTDTTHTHTHTHPHPHPHTPGDVMLQLHLKLDNDKIHKHTRTHMKEQCRGVKLSQLN